MNIEITRPKNYMYGAFHVSATLNKEEAEYYKNFPILFQIAQLPKRLIITPSEYVVAATDEQGTSLKGQFKEGRWEANIYTNGVHEDKNPTPINLVKETLKNAITKSVKEAKSATESLKRINDSNHT